VKYQRVFGSGADDAFWARRFAKSTLAALSVRPPDDAVLAVGELAANALLHGESPFTVSLERTGASLHIAVSDASPEPPQKALSRSFATSGRGMLIVEQVATAWGWDALPEGGKTVWAEVPVDGPGNE
jgi:anti-sigma regulatory factor (Ser/Thr protein kinase)